MTMYHFVYKTTLKGSKKFYIGRKSTKYKSLDQYYFGSGVWVKSIKDKSRLRRKVLAFADSTDELLLLELKYIRKHINNPNCMNWSDLARGAGSGKRNPMQNPDTVKNHKGVFKKGYISPAIRDPHLSKLRMKAVVKVLKNDNPMWRKEIKEKFAASRKNNGKPWHSKKARLHMSLARTGKPLSSQHKKAISKALTGKTLSEEHKHNLRKPKRKIKCPYCKQVGGISQMKRWHFNNCKQ